MQRRSPHGRKPRRRALPAHLPEAEQVTVESQSPFQIGNLQMHATDLRFSR
jgi:hypothetical protein